MQILHYTVGMNLNLFRDLEKLHQTGNFSHAAALSNLSQPAFSRRIQSLEDWVGATLVDRSRQPVKLTDAGQQILKAGLQALTQIEAERNYILEAQALPKKYVFTFAAQHSIAWRFYPTWLQELEEAYQLILSRLRADNLYGCIGDLSEGSVDFVIAYLDRKGKVFDSLHPRSKQPSRLRSLIIGKDKLIPVCQPRGNGDPLYHLDSQDDPMPYLQFGSKSPVGMLLEPLFRQKNLEKRLLTVYENSMAGALRIRAQAGDGIAWLPQSLVAPDLANGKLIYAGGTDWQVDIDIHIFKHQDHDNYITRALWSFLETRQPLPCITHTLT